MSQELDKFMEDLAKNAGHSGLLQNAYEWVKDGWNLDHEPEPEQLAAAIFMEAKFQDGCVIRGESVASFPKDLRKIAYAILRLVGHEKE